MTASLKLPGRRALRAANDPQQNAASGSDAGGPSWALVPYSVVFDSFAAIEASFPDWKSGGSANLGGNAIGLRMKVPVHLGRGTWDFIKASEDIYAMLVDAEYRQDEKIIVAGDRLFKARILLSGRLSQPDSGISLQGTGAILEAFPGTVASSYIVGSEGRARFLVLHCRPELLTDRFGLDIAELPEPIDTIFQNTFGPPRGRTTALGPDVLRAANDVLNAPTQYPARLLSAFVAAKAEEIVCSVLRQLKRAPQSQAPGTMMSVRDVSRMYEARDILLEQYVRPPSVAALARQVGVNRTKLKANYKAVFNITIADFIQQLRMERAMALLTDSELTIAEVGYAVGYEYPANFTHAFKRFFAQVPKDIRRRIDRHPCVPVNPALK